MIRILDTLYPKIELFAKGLLIAWMTVKEC